MTDTKSVTYLTDREWEPEEKLFLMGIATGGLRFR